MKIVFMGNPEFAVSSLDSLVKSDHQISAVVTILLNLLVEVEN